MNKVELIETIRSVNKSATAEFLAEFSVTQLYDYVRQLNILGLLPATDHVGAATPKTGILHTPSGD